ncbi:hypothetical protein SALBM311S_04896 [Streptomyces alboniger]
MARTPAAPPAVCVPRPCTSDPSKGYKGSLTLGVDPDAENTGAGGGGGGTPPSGAPSDAPTGAPPSGDASPSASASSAHAQPCGLRVGPGRRGHALTVQLALAPKPGLPDPRDLAARAGHRDHNSLRWSAKALAPGLAAMAAAARRTGEPTPQLRTELGAIGRCTEHTVGLAVVATGRLVDTRTAESRRRPPSTPVPGRGRSPRPPS